MTKKMVERNWMGFSTTLSPAPGETGTKKKAGNAGLFMNAEYVTANSYRRILLNN